jgi:glutamate racemase
VVIPHAEAGVEATRYGRIGVIGTARRLNPESTSRSWTN